MKIYNGFIGADDSNVILNFLGSDNLETYEKKVAEVKDWYYKDKEITYSLNEYGHRCKSIKEIDLDNYILFLGCSNTEGIGVELEKSFPYLVSQSMNCDYYNLAVEGTGIDVLEHNLVNWFYTVKQKPKYVVLQYPGYTRFVAKFPGYSSFLLSGTWSEDEYSKRFIASADILGYFQARSKICSSLINHIVDVPKIKINFGGIKEYEFGLTVSRVDWARDFIHAGIKSNEKIAQLITEQMK